METPPPSDAPERGKPGPPPPIDWGAGQYERTAAQLLPAAERLVERAALRRGERVLDVGCGTGNAALLAAARGASVTGVDPAARLLEVARGRAAAEGLDATFVAGDAANLPAADGSVDAVLSVFGVIFAPDPHAAAAEIGRVTTPDGRVVLAAWIPGGAISEVNRVAREAVMRALGASPGPPPFSWHDPDALAALFGPHGFTVTAEEHPHPFTAPSAREFLEAEWTAHPVAAAGRRVLDREPGAADEVLRQALAALEDGNEADAGFRVTSRYVIATARRP
jgi:SAM-dependent methyltransferase